MITLIMVSQIKLSQSREEQASLVQQVSELEREVGEVRQHLQEENQRCRLLMDYPFVKQTMGGSGGIPSQKQISANTIRILLLEEQNHELRERAVQSAQTLRLEEGDMFQVGVVGVSYIKACINGSSSTCITPPVMESCRSSIASLPNKPSPHPPFTLQSEYCCFASIVDTGRRIYYIKDGEGLGPRSDRQFISI